MWAIGFRRRLQKGAAKRSLLTISVVVTLAGGVIQARAAAVGRSSRGGSTTGARARHIFTTTQTDGLGFKHKILRRPCPAVAKNAPGHAVKLLNGRQGKGAGTHPVRCDAPHPCVISQVRQTVTVRACGRTYRWRMFVPPLNLPPTPA